jgi:uncharacterized protein (TIGR02452 family)
MDLVALAHDTLAILARGEYVAPSGRTVELDLERCVRESRTWSTEELADLSLEPRVGAPGAPRPGASLAGAGHLDAGPRGAPLPSAFVAVTEETTGAAARRLAAEGPVAVLSFASAVSVGGGFLRGAKAQEEDLCRCSALFACLEPQRGYYVANRAAGSDLYTDRLITSPDVPFFRDERLGLLEAPFLASVITAPAPCARELRMEERAQLPSIFERRVANVLAVAETLGHRRLVLGAWGCGAFRNDPVLVADVFARALEGPFRAAFERVDFAVYDPSPEQKNLSAFRERLGR